MENRHPKMSIVKLYILLALMENKHKGQYIADIQKTILNRTERTISNSAISSNLRFLMIDRYVGKAEHKEVYKKYRYGRIAYVLTDKGLTLVEQSMMNIQAFKINLFK